MFGYPYGLRFWSIFLCSSHLCLVSSKLSVGEFSAYSTQFLKSSLLIISPGSALLILSGS